MCVCVYTHTHIYRERGRVLFEICLLLFPSPIFILMISPLHLCVFILLGFDSAPSASPQWGSYTERGLWLLPSQHSQKLGWSSPQTPLKGAGIYPLLQQGLCAPVWLFATPWAAAHQAPLSMWLSRQEYWGGLPFPPPGDLPDPETEPASLVSPALQMDSLRIEPLGRGKILVQSPLLKLPHAFQRTSVAIQGSLLC